MSLVAVILGAAASPWVKDPHRFGEGFGRFLFFAALVTAGVSYLWQRGKRRLAVGVAVGVVALIAAITVTLVKSFGSESATAPLTAAERAPLEVKNGKVVHRTLHFSFDAPGPDFVPAHEEAARAAATAMPGHGETTAWAFRCNQTGEAVMALLMKGPANSREALEGIAEGFRKSLLDAGGSTAAQPTENIVWTETEHSASFTATLPNGPVVVCRFLAAPTFVVGVMVTLADPAQGAAIANSLALK